MHAACLWPVENNTHRVYMAGENSAHCMHLASGKQCTLHDLKQWSKMHTACLWLAENNTHCLHLASGKKCTLHAFKQWKIMHTACLWLVKTLHTACFWTVDNNIAMHSAWANACSNKQCTLCDWPTLVLKSIVRCMHFTGSRWITTPILLYSNTVWHFSLHANPSRGCPRMCKAIWWFRTLIPNLLLQQQAPQVCRVYGEAVRDDVHFFVVMCYHL